MQSGLFESVTTDVSGKIRLDSEDPRWIQLLSSSNVAAIAGDPTGIKWFCDRLIENNPVTGNYLQLLALTTMRLQQICQRKSAPSPQSVNQLCMALHLSALVLQHFVACLSSQALRVQLFLPVAWPQHVQEEEGGHGVSVSVSRLSGPRVVEPLIDQIAVAIDAPLAHTWMRDVKFFCADLLLSACSTQLYKLSNHASFDNSPHSGSTSFSSDADLFLNHLYLRGERQLREALGGTQVHNSEFFSAALPVRMVRGLVASALCSEAHGGGTASAGAGSGTAGASKAVVVAEGELGGEHCAMLLQLMQQHGVRLAGDEEQAGLGAGYVGEDGAVAGVGVGAVLVGDSRNMAMAFRALLLAYLVYLPLGALERLFRMAGSGRRAVEAMETREARQAREGGKGGGSSSRKVYYDDAPPLDDAGMAMGMGGTPGLGLGVDWQPLPVPGAMLLPADPLSERCLGLLLVLLHNRRAPGRPNPFREAFSMLHDQSVGDGTAETIAMGPPGGGTGGGVLSRRGGGSSLLGLGGARIHVDFRQLIAGLCAGLPGESSALLLYALLQAHPTFLELLLATGSLSALLSACLRGLYLLTARKTSASYAQASAQHVSRLYVLAVCVLMLVQDNAVAAQLRVRADPLWYQERLLGEVSLLDVTLLCLLRAVMFAVFRLQDAYLLSNCCAILHNLAPHLAGLHPYTAERIVKVACQLSARTAKAFAQQTSEVGTGVGLRLGLPSHDSADSISATATSAYAYASDAGASAERALLPEALSALMLLLDTALRAERRTQNVQVAYALLHEYATVAQHLTHPAVAQALGEECRRAVAKETLQQQGAGVEVEAEVEAAAAVAGRIAGTARYFLTAVEALAGEKKDRSLSAPETMVLLRCEIEKAVEGDLAAQQYARSSGGSSGRRRQRRTYQEAENPEDYWVPCVWTNVLRSAPELPWRLLGVTLVDPLSCGLLYLHRLAHDRDGVEDERQGQGRRMLEGEAESGQLSSDGFDGRDSQV